MQMYKDMIRNGDISYVLANSEEGLIAKILVTESGPKTDLENMELSDVTKMALKEKRRVSSLCSSDSG